MWSAKCLKRSVAYNGIEAVTFECTYPRMIHSEMLRHRALSHCVASSRAIPSHLMRKTVDDTPFTPLEWSAKSKGMGTNKQLIDGDERVAKELWDKAIDCAIGIHHDLDCLGLNKQYVNRIIEPYSWVTDVITGTDFTSAYMLRSPLYKANTDPQTIAENLVAEQPHMSIDYAKHLVKNTDPNAAQPEIRKIFDMMFEAVQNAPTVKCHHDSGLAHLPYTIQNDYDEIIKNFDLWTISKQIPLISSARCGRVSYLNQGEVRPHNEDIEWAKRANDMGHMSVFDHVLFPVEPVNNALVNEILLHTSAPYYEVLTKNANRFGNLRGFKSLRYRIEEGSFDVNAN